MIACQFGKDRCSQTPCLSLSLFFFFPFLFKATGLCHKRHSWGSFCFALFFLNVCVCGGGVLLWYGFFALFFCAGGLQNWFVRLEVGQVEWGEHLLPQRELRAGSDWWETLHQTTQAEEAACALLSPLLVGSGFGVSWDFTVELNKVPSPLRGWNFCPQSPRSCDQKGSSFGRT